MKILIVILLLICSSCCNSQNKQVLSGALYFGGFFPGDDFLYYPETGFNIGVDIETRKDNFGFYLNGTYNRSKQRPTIITFEYPTAYEKQTVSVIEIYTGLRWYMGSHEGTNGSGEFGLGYYHTGTTKISGGGQFGFSIGAALNYPVSHRADLSLKGRYHAFTKERYTAYGGLYLGLRYSFNR
jgi:hypothetical protein